MIVTKSDYRHTKSPVSCWNRLPFSLHIISVSSLLILGCISTIHNLYNLFVNSPAILKPLKYSLTHGRGQRELYTLLAGSTQSQVKGGRASKITTNLNWGQRKETPRPPRLMGNQLGSAGFQAPRGPTFIYRNSLESGRSYAINKQQDMESFCFCKKWQVSYLENAGETEGKEENRAEIGWNGTTFPGLCHGSGAQIAPSLQGVGEEQGAYSGNSSVAPQISASPTQCHSLLGGVAFCFLSFLPPGSPCLWLGSEYIIIDHGPGNSPSSVPGHSLLTHQSLSIDLELRSVNSKTAM